MNSIPFLTIITFLPILGMVLILLMPKGSGKTIRYTSLFITILQMVLTGILLSGFNFSLGSTYNEASFQFVEKLRWIEVQGPGWLGMIKIDYFVGLDGLSAPMLILTVLISFVSVISSWKIDKSEKGYFAMLLLLNTGMVGVFVALDFFLFYIFWELMLLPMYFLIGIWGGPRKEYAAIKFFIYTLFGSIFILIVMIGLYLSAKETLPGGQQVFTFNMLALSNSANYTVDGVLSHLNPDNFRLIAYILMFIGFAIKIPMFPFHTWLPDAHVEAPTPVSVILAGVLLKMGGYGIIRILFPMFPDITNQLVWWIALFAMINIVYGALCAMAQKDYKKLIAYSSISHMGYVLLGLAAGNTMGLSGAILQMFNHGTITAMLFIIVGIIYDRAHTRGVEEFGGLANQMPVYTGFTIVAFFAALGLPGLSGFISESFVFLGAFEVASIRTLTIISTLGILLGAAYMLWTMQRVYLGTLPERWKDLKDMDAREYAMLTPLAVIVVLLGIFPSLLLSMMNSSVNGLVEILRNTAATFSSTGL